MAALGSGENLWRVDVVLRRSTRSDSETSAVVDVVTAWLDDPIVATDEEVIGGPRATYSFDLNPPEGSIGISCWVRADNIGQATQVGHDAVVAAAREVTGQSLPLWDLRVVPRSAMMTREEYGLT